MKILEFPTQRSVTPKPGPSGRILAVYNQLSTSKMPDSANEIIIRGLDTVDIGAVVRIDEKITGAYHPDRWETRVSYYLRRDPDAALVAEMDGEVVGFMLGEVRSGEFGLEEVTGWIEVLGVDPDCQGRSVGRHLGEAILTHFKSRGARSVRTLVDENMEEIAGFFASLGFEPASLRPFVKSL